jgi:hypothetical protein
VKIILTLFILLMLTSCDPMRRVIIKNNSAEPATITWRLKEDSAMHSKLFISNSKEVRFTIKNSPPHNVIRIPFGIGNWKKGDLQNLADDLESLEINSSSINVLLSTEEEIKAYLQANIRGILHKNIKIYVN